MKIREVFNKLFERPSAMRIFVPFRNGPRVDNETALFNNVFFACVRIISESIALLPWHVYQKTGKRTEQRNDDLDYLLHTQANPLMTAFSFREMIVAQAISYGNGYAEIERNGRGEPVWLHAIPSQRVEPAVTDDGRFVYIIKQLDNTAAQVEQENMLHIRGLGYDGIMGYNFVELMKHAIGTGLSMDEFAESFYTNGAQVGGIIENKTSKLSPKGVKAILNEFNLKFNGASKAFRTMYLDNGMEYKPLGITQKDAQFFESRRLNVEDIARPLRIPLHMLADLEHATFSNIEHAGIEFAVHCLAPWVARIEQEAQVKLIGRNSRYAGRFTKLNLTALLRGDVQSRFNAYALGRQNGWLSVNDIRELEDQNPIGPEGDIYIVPVNYMDAKTLLNPPATQPAPKPAAPPAEPEDIVKQFARRLKP